MASLAMVRHVERMAVVGGLVVSLRQKREGDESVRR